MSVESLLLLADARFPDGTHAHSHGLEAAVADGRLDRPGALREYVEARLWSTGRSDAAAARLVAAGAHLDAVDDALTLRTPSATVRSTSRSLGRSLIRTAGRLWPDQPIGRDDGLVPLQPCVLGAVASLLGCSADEAALAVAHGLAGTLATAALRLQGLDPFSVTAVLLDLRPAVAAVAASVGDVERIEQLPTASTPLAEIDCETQTTLDTRLFGS